jgi:DNA-binding MarR family transcriptional regulator
LPGQILSDQAFDRPAVRAFVGLVRGHTVTTRHLSGLLERDHGLSLSEYEVLLRLSRAPDMRLKRVELGNQVLLTPSGITRLLERLERAGHVERAACATDARVSYAVLTPAGAAKLAAASRTHLDQIRDLLGREFSEAELERLAALLARVPACEPEA